MSWKPTRFWLRPMRKMPGSSPGWSVCWRSRFQPNPSRKNDRGSSAEWGLSIVMDTISSILAAVAVVVALLVWRHYSARLEAARKVTDALQGEENRMFDFLHELGCAIQGDASLQKLYRMIVDGIDRVVTGRGGGLDLVSEEGGHCVPHS